jgi:hypothetical protein
MQYTLEYFLLMGCACLLEHVRRVVLASERKKARIVAGLLWRGVVLLRRCGG